MALILDGCKKQHALITLEGPRQDMRASCVMVRGTHLSAHLCAPQYFNFQDDDGCHIFPSALLLDARIIPSLPSRRPSLCVILVATSNTSCRPSLDIFVVLRFKMTVALYAHSVVMQTAQL